jgi:hypothetical protein
MNLGSHPHEPFLSKMIGLLRLRLFMVVMQEPLRVVLVMEFSGFCCCCARDIAGVVPENRKPLFSAS